MSSQAVARATALSCDIEALGRALALDTSRLVRHERETATGGSSGGLTAVEFTDSSGARRILLVVFYGETGNARYSFYFADTSGFVVRTVEERYGNPASMPRVQVVSRFETVRYLCGGRDLHVSQADASAAELTAIVAQADSLLRR
jgi:hypothetical protein